MDTGLLHRLACLFTRQLSRCSFVHPRRDSQAELTPVAGYESVSKRLQIPVLTGPYRAVLIYPEALGTANLMGASLKSISHIPLWLTFAQVKTKTGSIYCTVHESRPGCKKLTYLTTLNTQSGMFH